MSLSLTGIFRKKPLKLLHLTAGSEPVISGFSIRKATSTSRGGLSTLIVTESGEKVQPEDVEEAYREAEVISEIGVLQQDGKLVAVIVPKLSQIHASKEEAIGQAIREAVQRVSERLPSYERFSDFVLTRDSLARTRLGKIRRHLLAERYEREKARRDRAVNLGPIPLEEMPVEDLALVEDAAAKQVWDWFAEGAFSPTGELQPFKPGIGILLERFQTLVVPMAIHGTDRALPDGKLCPRPKPVMVEFGRPLSPRHLEQQGKGNRPAERILDALHGHLALLLRSSSAAQSR